MMRPQYPTREADSNIKNFTKFPELPKELQDRIFKESLPNPRLLDSAVIIVIGRNLNNPRAILPSLREFKEAFRHANRHIDFNDDVDETIPRRWDPANTEMRDERRYVFNILHACQTSRTAALSVYRLHMDSIIPEENVPWWNPDLDNLYFQQPRIDQNQHGALNCWLLGDDKIFPKNGNLFRSIQHVTLCLDNGLVSRLGLWRSSRSILEINGLLNLPNLESLNLLLDPGDNSKSWRGSILYYEPEDVLVNWLDRRRPAEIQVYVQNLLKKLGPENRETPDVNLFVMGVKSPRRKLDPERFRGQLISRILGKNVGSTFSFSQQQSVLRHVDSHTKLFAIECTECTECLKLFKDLAQE